MEIKNTDLIKEIAYDNFKKELKITFRNNKQYLYSDVPKDVINEMELAGSMDNFFENNIKNYYSAVKTTDADQLLFS